MSNGRPKVEQDVYNVGNVNEEVEYHVCLRFKTVWLERDLHWQTEAGPQGEYDYEQVPPGSELSFASSLLNITL